MTNLGMIPLSPVRRAGNFLFLSGQLGFVAPGQLAAGGIEAQTRQAIANIGAVLKSEGADLSHIVRTGVWLVQKSDFPIFNTVYAELMGPPFPARSTVVSELLIPNALVEIEAVAFLP